MTANTAAGTLPEAVRHILLDRSPKAASFIVTIYGDVVEPRGGTLWMGTLIDCCARHGISESLVRTAVSRLVSAGRFVGERVGRKSYYRLTEAGQDEFRQASHILFSPSAPPEGWAVALVCGDDLPPGWARIGPQAALAPYRKGIRLPGGTIMRAQSTSADHLTTFAAQHWPLDEVEDTYRAFIARFAPIREGSGIAAIPGEDALALRLRLVDEYRRAALSDPRLPSEALPQDWPATEARRVFRKLYLALSPAADLFIGGSFADSRGLLRETTPKTKERAEDLRRG